MTDAEGNFWLEDRIQKIQSVVEQYGEDQFYISFSGGKDSTVLHYLMDEALPGNRIPRVYCNTGLEPEEIWKLIRLKGEDRLIILPSDPNEMVAIAEELLSRACRLHREAEAALGGHT